MTFPSEKKLKGMRGKLDKAEPTRALPENATTAQRVKYKTDLFTIDKLVELAEKLDPNFDIKVA